MTELVFGTDGWRGIIGREFTFENLARAVQAYAHYIKRNGNLKVVVGFDTRFNAHLFARHAAEVLAANGLEVLLTQSYLPSPALSFAVKHFQAGGGLMLTASHNSPAYLGLKLKGPYGGTATQDIYEEATKSLTNLRKEDIARFESAKHSIRSFNIKTSYFDALKGLVNLETLTRLDGDIVHEAMGGASTAWLSDFFTYVGIKKRIYDFHPRPDPMFYGQNPEPTAPNLQAVIAYMKNKSDGLALTTDGDGDRIGAVLPGGKVFNAHQIFAVLLKASAQKGIDGQVVKTFTVSRIIERLAGNLNYGVTETPVGFKYIVNEMLQKRVAVGGEESGGIAVAKHIPERDGLANSLLLLEAEAVLGKRLTNIFSDIEKDVDWAHAYSRRDIQVKDKQAKKAVMQSLTTPPTTFANRRVISVEGLDGLKLNLENNAWLAFRPSGTEPVLRIYCEAATDKEVASILNEAELFTKTVA